jgi:hypothetical protein
MNCKSRRGNFRDSLSQCSLVAGFLRPLVELERRTSGEWSALVLAHP